MSYAPINVRRFRIVTALLFGALGLAGAMGCGHSKSHHLEPGPAQLASDLGLPEGLGDTTGFILLEEAPSTGRFPAGLAVGHWRELGPDNEPACRQLTTLREEQAVHWNSLFNGVPAIREVIMLGERTPGPAGSGVQAVAANAARLDARLCVIYGSATAEPDNVALVGALMDTSNGQTVAYVQARATPADFEAKRPDGMAGDRRHRDLEYLAARRFENEVRRCVLTLIQRDGAGSPLQSPWKTALEASEEQQSE